MKKRKLFYKTSPQHFRSLIGNIDFPPLDILSFLLVELRLPKFLLEDSDLCVSFTLIVSLRNSWLSFPCTSLFDFTVILSLLWSTTNASALHLKLDDPSSSSPFIPASSTSWKPASPSPMLRKQKHTVSVTERYSHLKNEST